MMMAFTLSSSAAPFLLSEIRIPTSCKLANRLHPCFPTWVDRKPHLSLRASMKSDDEPYDTQDQQQQEEFMGLDILEQFIQLNVGSWSGHFTQYDALGNALQRIPTRLAADSYGKGEQVSLYQTLNIKQPPPKTYITGETVEDDGWAEFKLGETNLLTIDRRQQVGYFPSEKAYTVSHQTAEMLDKVLRAGVLGEDGDNEKDFPKGVKLPSRRPSLVCESCLYSIKGDSRVRAFHVLDPRGILDMIGVFQERKNDGFVSASDDLTSQGETQGRLDALLGCWSGHSVTRRTGIYGSTVAEEDVNVVFRMEDDGTIIQEIRTSRGELQLTGAVCEGLIKFDKGLQMTLLPGGMALASPVSVGQSVGRSQAFYLEFSWIQSPGKRRRLVRTYDTDGVVVSTNLVDETKL